MSNETGAEALNLALDRMKDALDGAKGIPEWGVVLVVLVSLLCAIILLHVLALLTAAPCLWALWRRRMHQQRNLLLDDGVENGEVEILDPPVDVEPEK